MLPEIVVSTDIAGVIGNPYEIVRRVYKPFFDAQMVKGVELVGLQPLDKRITDARREDPAVSCIHGRTGGENEPMSLISRAVLIASNKLLIPTPKLFREFYGDYDVLVHAPELRSSKNYRTAVQQGWKKKILWVENHLDGEGSLNETISNVWKLRNDGVNSGILFDLCHYMGQKNLAGNLFARRWDDAMEKIIRLAKLRDSKGVKIPVSLHFPLGRVREDSIPLGDTPYFNSPVTDKMLSGFRDVLKEAGDRIDRITFEYQDSLTSYIKPGEKRIAEAEDRIVQIFNRFKDMGINQLLKPDINTS